VRFLDEERAIAANPDLALGGVIYGWLKATLESIGVGPHEVVANLANQALNFNGIQSTWCRSRNG
jgi:hypothetical protein